MRNYEEKYWEAQRTIDTYAHENKELKAENKKLKAENQQMHYQINRCIEAIKDFEEGLTND